MEITAYFSHSIRGSKGNAATDEDMEQNCLLVKKVAEELRSHLPQLDIYVPAEHEDFVHIAWKQGMLSEEQILKVDCEIVAQKDLLLVLVKDGWRGGGIGVEIDKATRCGIPIFYVEVVDDVTVDNLRTLLDVIEEKKRQLDLLGSTTLQPFEKGKVYGLLVDMSAGNLEYLSNILERASEVYGISFIPLDRNTMEIVSVPKDAKGENQNG